MHTVAEWVSRVGRGWFSGRGRAALNRLLRDDSGAVQVFGVVAGAVLFGVMWNVVSVGSAIVWRERAQDIADAAGFENALWHARGMNLMVIVNLIAAIVMSLLVAWRMIILAMLALAIPTYGASLSVAEAMIEQDEDVSDAVHQVASAAPYLQEVIAVATPYVANLQTSITMRKRYGERGRLQDVYTISSSIFPSALVAALGDSASVGATDLGGGGGVSTGSDSEVEGDVARAGGSIAAGDFEVEGDLDGVSASGRVDVGGIEVGGEVTLGRDGQFDFDLEVEADNSDLDDTGSASDQESEASDASEEAEDGFGIGLPGQLDPWQTLCGQAGELAGETIAERVPDIPLLGSIARSLIRWGFEEATEGAPDPFCQDWEGFQRAAVGLAKKGCKLFGPFKFGVGRLCKKAVKKALKGVLGDGEQRSDGNEDELATIGAPPYFENGGDAAQTWSFIRLQRAAVANADLGLRVMDLTRSDSLPALRARAFLDWTMAGAEFYADCRDNWGQCAEDSMWRLAWRTRLRRFRHPLGLLYGAADVAAGQADQYLGGLEGRVQSEILGWVQQVAARAVPEMGELSRFMEEQLDARVSAVLRRHVNVTDRLDLSQSAHQLVESLDGLPDVLVH